jgi:hypothetical protein
MRVFFSLSRSAWEAPKLVVPETETVYASEFLIKTGSPQLEITR